MSAAKARLFVALDLPPRPRATLAQWAQRELSAQPGLRLVAPEYLHVTLCFLGWRAEEEIGALGELVQACSSPPPRTQLSIGPAAWLPPRRPRVLAVGLADPDGSVAALQARISAMLAAHAGHEPETRRFRPHVTVARVGRGSRQRALELQGPPTRRFAGQALTLYRSRPGPDGSRYEPVARTPLGPADTLRT